MTFSYAVFPKLNGASFKQYTVKSFDAFCKLLAKPETYPSKEAMPLFCPMEFNGKRTSKGALRHNAAVENIYGACGDHDSGTMPIEEAAARLERAGVEAFLYTTPSYTVDAPRWRVVAPFSKPTKNHDAHLFAVERLNHILGGTLKTESFTLSQSFYFGRKEGAKYATYRVNGKCIDTLDYLPRLPKRMTPGDGVNGARPGSGNGIDHGSSDAELIRLVVSGEEIHPAMVALTARWAARGMKREEIVQSIVGIVTSAQGVSEDRMTARISEVPRTVDSALAKYAPLPMTVDPARSVLPDAERNADLIERATGGEPDLDRYFVEPLELPDMLTRYAYIAEGVQVASLDDPRVVLPLDAFRQYTQGSKTWVPKVAGGLKKIKTADMWVEHARRLTLWTRTFKAGAEPFTKAPSGMTAVNAWRPIPHRAPKDWQRLAKPFLDHVEYLVPKDDERDLFLDWLAHIEQQPQVLPHLGFLMVTPMQGVGRSTLAYMLGSVWPGYTAVDVNLPGLLEGGFNGVIAGRVLATVNEINEGTSVDRYRMAERLKSLLTDAVRTINPKYGRQYEEFNACRWLMFSNHMGALPLAETDRRMCVIENPTKPKSVSYFEGLYKALHAEGFGDAVREFLRRRDIRKFKPGAPAPMNESKRKLLDTIRPEADTIAGELVAEYPTDLISGDVLRAKFDSVSPLTWAHALGRRGAVKVGRITVSGIRVYIWALRNGDIWSRATQGDWVKELNRKAK